MGARCAYACRSAEPAFWKARIEPTLCRLRSEKLVQTRIGTLILEMSGVMVSHHSSRSGCLRRSAATSVFRRATFLVMNSQIRANPLSTTPPGVKKSRYASVNPSQGQIAFNAGGFSAATLYCDSAR